MTLEEVIEVMEKGISGNKLVARVHTGDPSILEQYVSKWMNWIKET